MPNSLSLALYQPDIPQNVGGALRLGACLGVAVHIIEPCGFVFDDKRLRRAGMDYLDQVMLTRHSSWENFERWRRGAGKRLVLLTTKASESYLDVLYTANDTLLMGRESAGVPEAVAQAADLRVSIPMHPQARSLNVVTAAAMALGEGLRQIRSAI